MVLWEGALMWRSLPINLKGTSETADLSWPQSDRYTILKTVPTASLLQSDRVWICSVFTMAHVWACYVTLVRAAASFLLCVFLISPSLQMFFDRNVSGPQLTGSQLWTFILKSTKPPFLSFFGFLIWRVLLFCCQNTILAVTSLPGCEKVSNTAKPICPLFK